MRENETNTFLMRDLSPTFWRWSLVLVVVLAAAVALGGIALPPIEAHEVFVLTAAQGMHEHNDWVVPWFNGEYHLTKPPLSYWLTAFSAWASGGIDHIQPWHGRLPSALAGVGLALLTALSGRKLFDAASGLLAALVLASSVGFFYYTHSARPEMLYAFLCAAAFTAYVYARQMSPGHPAQKISSHLIWLAFGLATLTKGPHLPAIFLVAFAIDCRLRGLNLRQSFTLLQPVSGLILLLAIALPWWWLLQHRLGSSGISGTQLSGSLLTLHILQALSPYYLYRPLQLLLPWLLFLPALACLPWREKTQSGTLPLLSLTVVLCALVLSFGPQKRWYYMMPALMPMCLLLAAGMMEFFRRHSDKWRWSGYLHWLLLLPIAGFIVVGNTALPWSENRFSQHRLALAARDQVAAGRPLIAWEVTPEIYVYYTHSTVAHVGSLAELLALLDKTPGKPYSLLLQTDDIKKLPPALKPRLLQQLRGGEDNPVSLLQIN